MMCEGCVYSIKSKILPLKEVKNVNVDLGAHEVYIDTDLPVEVIKEAINKKLRCEMLEYSEKVLKEFMNPKNMGKLEQADGIDKLRNPVCGDVMWIYIKVGNDVIVDVKFQSFGCVAAIATSSKVTELVKGKRIEEAMKITNKVVAEALDGLPPVKMHCSLLAEQDIKAAIEDYLAIRSSKSP